MMNAIISLAIPAGISDYRVPDEFGVLERELILDFVPDVDGSDAKFAIESSVTFSVLDRCTTAGIAIISSDIDLFNP